MTKLLSSDWTFFFKFILSTLLVLLLGSTAICLGIPLWTHRPGFSLGSDWFYYLFLLWIFGPFVILWGVRLKQVRMDDDFLYVSNYFREEKIPLTQVARADQGFFGGNSSVKVRFVDDTVFGRSIIFKPSVEYRSSYRFWEHPVVVQVGQAVYRAKEKNK